MMLLPRSLSARLTLVVTLGASVVLGICLTTLYLALDSQLQEALDVGLQERSRDLEVSVDAGSVDAGRAGIIEKDHLAQLYDGDGTLLAGSSGLAGHRLLSARQVRQVTGEAFDDRQLATGPNGAAVPARLLSRRMGTGDDVLTVGVSAESVDAARERLLAVVFGAAPLLLGMLAALVWFVVRSVLRPVGLLTKEASAISSLESDRPLPTVPGSDEIARLARTLDEMLGRLRVAFTRERAFVDDASHELRTPIAILQGELELALATPGLPGEVETSLQAARREAERLSRLAEDLLLLAREQAGILVITSEPIDLFDLVEHHARRLAPALGLRIQVHGDPAVVRSDAGRLRQALANLAANSAAAGATEVRIGIARHQNAVTIEVADDGPGFAEHVLGSAFDRFVRGDQARTSSGAGLGLSIVRAVIAAHGGTIEVANGSALGGAVVTIRLPV